MLRELMDDALKSHGFTIEALTDSTGYYVLETDSSVRFAVLHTLNDVIPPEQLNSKITQNAPSRFREHPAFKKNSDLICILHLGQLSEFKLIEDKIFAIEEDPYQYKKYVLYYNDTEERMLENITYQKLLDIVSDKSKFEAYKENPLIASQYSIAAKVFIKLPFLMLQHDNRELVPLHHQAEEVVSEANLTELYKLIQNVSDQDTDIDQLIMELIEHELENIKD